jgi:hypothetical protein
MTSNAMASDNNCTSIADGISSFQRHNKNNNKYQVTQQLRLKQLSILTFLNTKFLTPPTQTIALLTTMVTPRKPTHTLRSPHQEITPVKLDFSSEIVLLNATEARLLPTPYTPPSTLIPNPKQTKITQFFTHLYSRPQSRHIPVMITCPPPAIPIKKNATRQKLLNYHLRSNPSVANHQFSHRLPHYALLDSWGHSMPVIDSSTVFRVVLQNQNGLSLTYDAISLRDELTTCSQYGPAIVHLPETNVNWNRPDQRMAFKSAVYRTWMNSVITVSRSPEDFLSNYQPGGTATIICNNWISRVTNKGEDHMGLGRWSYDTLRGIGSKKVTIITAYNASYITGDTTNYRQQQRTLSCLHCHHNQHVNAQPRKLFILDLQAWISHLMTENNYPDGKLVTLIATCGLVDPLVRQHSSRPIPPSHDRGSDRIDFMLVSPNLMSAVLSSGCLSSHTIFNSDH